ncbi:MAG: histidine kinase [Chitinophagales bacterium]|nr:histidine kinase [Chitinophagales bacterium]
MKNTIAFLLFTLVLTAKAQTPAFKNTTKQNGLPANSIYHIIQDSKQYLWLGTDKGLVRFDGLHFKTYLHNELSGISDLRIDSEGALRCQSFTNHHYYMKSDSLYADTSWLNTGNFSPVLEDSKGNSYQRAYNTIYCHSRKSTTLSFASQVLALFRWKQDVYAFSKDSVYNLSNKVGAKKIPLLLNDEKVFFPVNFENKVLIFPKRVTNGSILAFMPKFEVLSTPLHNVSIQTVSVIRDSLLFVCTNNGLYVLNKHLQLLPIQQPLLVNSNVSSVYNDHEGRIWVGTLDNGLFQFDCWECLLLPVNEPVSVVSWVPSIKKLLIGTVDGQVYEWTEQTGLRKIFESSYRQPITAVWEHTDNTLFVAGDVFVIKEEGAKPIEIALAVKKIEQLGTNQYLLGRTGGITLLQKRIDSAMPMIGFGGSKHWWLKDPYVINNGNIRVKNVVANTQQHMGYAITSVGLFHLNSDTFSELRKGKESLLWSDLILKNDELIGITGTSIVSIGSGGSNFQETGLVNAPEGLKNIRTGNSEIWVSSGSKVYRMKNTRSKPAIYELSNGFEVNDFCVADGKVFLAGDEGVSFTSVAGLQIHPHPLQLHIENFSDGQRQLDVSESTQLSHANNNLLLKFSVPYFGKQEDLQIQYSVNDDHWQQTETGLRELKLISLEPGSYSIKLQARTAVGNVSPAKEVRFVIRPPFWKTWWFYILSLCAVAAVGYTLYRYRIKILQQQNNLEKQKMELENKLRESILASVKAQMNPHFIFNALNTIQSFIYLNDKQNATSYLGKFSQLTRTILEMSNKNSVSLQEEIDAILLYLDLEKTRFDEEMNFTIEVAPNINPSLVHIPSMIIQPYIENAVKHGLLHKKGERWLKCSFELKDNFLKVTIDDNGVGRVRSHELNKIKNKQHQSFATQANEKRLDALNRGHAGAVNVQYTDKISADSEPQGTTVELMIAVLEQ